MWAFRTGRRVAAASVTAAASFGLAVAGSADTWAASPAQCREHLSAGQKMKMQQQALQLKKEQPNGQVVDVKKEVIFTINSTAKAPEPAQAQDVAFALQAVQKNGMALQALSKELQADRRVVLEAVRRNGAALQFAATPLLSDHEVVHEAVKQCSMAFDFAQGDLRNDQELLRMAGWQSGW